MMKHKKQKDGFILLEILVALVVLAVGILFLIQALSKITNSNKRIRDNQFALMQIDNIFNRLYSGEELSGDEFLQFDGKKFFYKLYTSVLSEKLQKITIEINWKDRASSQSAEASHVIIVR